MSRPEWAGTLVTAMRRAPLVFVPMILVITACGADSDLGLVFTPSELATSECSGTFIAHDLEHETSGGSVETSLFDGTGAGVSLADLDGDGDNDIVLPNLSGATSVMWNQTELEFTRQPIIEGRFRQVAPIDLNDDGRLDLVLTTGIGRPVVLINQEAATGVPEFERVEFPALTDVAYSIGWGDVDGDGDLDIATGSYNAELTAQRDMASVMGRNSGVTFYENTDGTFDFKRMSDVAQALVVKFHDVDADGSTDLMVGNDLATPDELWLRADGRWIPTDLFDRTTFSTMSLDASDVDNDGDLDIYATDMHPMSDDSATLEKWQPVFEDMDAIPRVDDIQAMENVLLVDDDGEFRSAAPDLGVPYTGWSWSGVFGDLDNDGFVDLYVVNGMESLAVFPNLEGGALVEENQAFRNDMGAGFEPQPDWGLGDTAGGRGMAMADLDADGDLDIVVNNLNAPSRIFENQLCGGSSLTLDLQWSDSSNPDAIGARVDVRTVDGERLARIVETNRGYLSSSGTGVHFGLGDAEIESITITWPDGEVSSAPDVQRDSHLLITRERP